MDKEELMDGDDLLLEEEKEARAPATGDERDPLLVVRKPEVGTPKGFKLWTSNNGEATALRSLVTGGECSIEDEEERIFRPSCCEPVDEEKEFYFGPGLAKVFSSQQGLSKDLCWAIQSWAKNISFIICWEPISFYRFGVNKKPSKEQTHFSKGGKH
ncbi:unnamed protein product [Eruca vesicaria subsp. sativa]|uniref:Uncharacterized protein n=1 Tax=Eruca vesicaria subsp. sativa TaxID=29727 RepID=A0ABC8MA79_ERUVS|nr:unnamed protein product [Eruca vesicaria subsp. sativa]